MSGGILTRSVVRFLALGSLHVALMHAVPAFAASPSFSCARPAGAAEQAVCSDGTLAALDRETARLYRLAQSAPGLGSQQKRRLTAFQRGWIKGRDDCWKSNDTKLCVRDAYVMRISELRAAPAESGGKDKGGVSIGPVPVRCPGMPAMTATFVNVDPPLAYLAGGGNSLVMTLATLGSGARYTAPDPAGEATFWQKGPVAIVQLPGGKEQSCNVGSVG